MANPITASRPLPVADDIPIVFEDEDREGMGETNIHTRIEDILLMGMDIHLAERHPQLRAFKNMNLYYRERPLHEKSQSRPYVSPDVMVVEPYQPLPENVTSYTIGKEGPEPRVTFEVLSQGTAEEVDLGDKLIIYAKLRIPEYILVDPSAEFVPQRLLLKRLRVDATWADECDADGGVTSQLGFRVVLEADGKVRLLDARTGRKYPRPDETWALAKAQHQAEQTRQAAEQARQAAEQRQQDAEANARREAEARQKAEQRVRELEAELERRRSAE